MSIVKTKLGTDESARRTRFEPTGTIASTNTQKAIEEVATDAAAAYAPIAADYIVGTSNGTLTAELVATSTTSIAVDIATPGQAQFKRAALTGDVTASANSNATTIANDAVSFAKMQNIATDSLVGRDTASSGDPENILLNATLEMDGSGNLRRAALTGDVTASAGSNATTIANDAVTFAKMQDITTDRLVGRDTALSGDPEEITVGGGVEFTGSAGIQRSALTGDVTASAGSNATTIANDAVTFAKMQNIATNSLIGRDTASSGDPENILLNATLEMDGSLNLQRAALTGDVTATAGSNSTTIANSAVSNAKMADMAQSTIKGRAAGAGTGAPVDLTATQATAILDAVVGDSGSGGTKGQVPAPAAGDAAAGKFLKADGTWAVPSGGSLGSTVASFSVTKSTDQTGVNSATYTKVTFDTEVYDIGSYWDAATNHRWTPPAGKISLDAAVFISGTITADAVSELAIYKNGSIHKGSQFNPRTNVCSMSLSIQDVANGTDYYELFAYITTSSGTATVAANSGVETFFMGTMI